MSPKRRTHQPAQRRPRSERACRFCRIAKQRCESIEYGTNDGPCRRCVSQGLDCNIPRAARSQSPSSGFGVQGSELVRHHAALRSAGGATTELTPGTETIVQYTPQQPEPIAVPMERWPSFMIHPGEQQGSSTTVPSPGQTSLQTQSFFPPASNMGDYQHGFPNVPHFVYYDYYAQTTSGSTYMSDYAMQGASDSAPNFGYAMEEPQPDSEGAFADEEEDASLSRSDES